MYTYIAQDIHQNWFTSKCSFETREEAINREKYFKTGIGREFLNKLLKNK